MNTYVSITDYFNHTEFNNFLESKMTTAPKDTGTTISIPVTDPETSVTPVPGTTAPTETNTTVTTKTTETLPQTGYSNGYRWLIGAAVLMTVTGAGIVLRTKKETK